MFRESKMMRNWYWALLFLLTLIIGCSDDIDSAVPQGNLSRVKALVDEGVDVNKVNKNGKSPLIEAIYHNHYDIAEFLIDSGADISLQDKNTGTSMHIASAKGNVEILQLLIDNGANVNEISNRLEETPIWQAVRWGKIEAVKFLLANGADPHAEVGWSGTLLHLSVCTLKNKHEITKLLIDKGLDVNAVDEYGKTPIYSAIGTMQTDKYGIEFDEIITLLLQSGVDMNHKDKDGRTPLEYAKLLEIERAEKILQQYMISSEKAADEVK